MSPCTRVISMVSVGFFALLRETAPEALLGRRADNASSSEEALLSGLSNGSSSTAFATMRCAWRADTLAERLTTTDGGGDLANPETGEMCNSTSAPRQRIAMGSFFAGKGVGLYARDSQRTVLWGRLRARPTLRVPGEVQPRTVSVSPLKSRSPARSLAHRSIISRAVRRHSGTSDQGTTLCEVSCPVPARYV